MSVLYGEVNGVEYLSAEISGTSDIFLFRINGATYWILQVVMTNCTKTVSEFPIHTTIDQPFLTKKNANMLFHCASQYLPRMALLVTRSLNNHRRAGAILHSVTPCMRC